jgi:hypothetical protein
VKWLRKLWQLWKGRQRRRLLLRLFNDHSTRWDLYDERENVEDNGYRPRH